MMKEKKRVPKKVIVKTMTVNKMTDIVHNFFENMKYMEVSGAIRSESLRKGDDGWWTFDHHVAGESRMKHRSVPEFGILDHIFVGEGLEWHVFVRIIPNEDGSTVTWTFIKPDGLGNDQFEKQLENFDTEIGNWKSVLENNDK
jgi:hypothetical protein